MTIINIDVMRDALDAHHMANSNETDALIRELWGQLGGRSEGLAALFAADGKGGAEGPEGFGRDTRREALDWLPSVYPVTDFATATIGLASLAVAEWGALRSGQPIAPVTVDRAHAAIAFRSERYLDRPGEAWPSLWDPIAGDYATRDGFVRLHTNYPHHRAAAERVLAGARDREAVAARVCEMEGEVLEAAIVAEGGCAAVMRSPEAWAAHPQGVAVQLEPTIRFEPAAGHASLGANEREAGGPVSSPLEGVRVLDLTRVIAGPICTRFLAAWGADVLRLDPPGFEEADALMADTTVGKRCAVIDLRTAEGSARFDRLLEGADVLVHGYRADALVGLGYDTPGLRARNPGLAVVALDAYGFEGPWQNRRGFDSLVQMSCGIAERGRAVFGTEVPRPLPAQALDHGSGYLMAAAACRALSERRLSKRPVEARLSLAGTAKALMGMGEGGDPEAPEPTAEQVAAYLVEEQGAFGRVRRVRCPGRIGGVEPTWRRAAGRIGGDEARWC